MPEQKYDPRTSTPAEILDTPEESETTITPISRLHYRSYQIWALWSKDTLEVSPQTMLDIAAYVEANRVQLEQEAQADHEHNKRAMEADMADAHRIKQEWHAYRHAGDETGPMVPSASDFEESWMNQ